MRYIDINTLPSVTTSESRLGALGWLSLFILFIAGFPLAYGEALEIGLNEGLAAMHSHFETDDSRGFHRAYNIVYFFAYFPSTLLIAAILFFRRTELKLDKDQLTISGGVRRTRTVSAAEIKKVSCHPRWPTTFGLKFNTSRFGLVFAKSWKNSDEFLYRLYQLRPDVFEEGLSKDLRARYQDD